MVGIVARGVVAVHRGVAMVGAALGGIVVARPGVDGVVRQEAGVALHGSNNSNSHRVSRFSL